MAALLSLCDRLDYPALSDLADLVETWGMLIASERRAVTFVARGLLEKRGKR
jgi:hypothetical protein